jgi:hypothetical protein
MMSPELPERQLSVFNYLRTHPGCSKEAVRRAVESIASRDTVRNILYEFEDNNLIVLKKDKPNSQIYHIYINYENELASVLDYSERIKSTYFALLGSVKERFHEITSELENLDRSNYKWNSKYRSGTELLKGLFYINKYLIDVCIVLQLFDHQEKVKDNETLMKIQFAINSAIYQIQIRLLDTISKYSMWLHGRGMPILARSVFLNPITIDIESLYLLKVIFYNNGLATSFDPVMDFMWEAGCKFADLRECVGFERFGMSQRFEDLNGWRGVLVEFGKYYENPSIVHDTRNNLRNII